MPGRASAACAARAACAPFATVCAAKAIFLSFFVAWLCVHLPTGHAARATHAALHARGARRRRRRRGRRDACAPWLLCSTFCVSIAQEHTRGQKMHVVVVPRGPPALFKSLTKRGHVVVVPIRSTNSPGRARPAFGSQQSCAWVSAECACRALLAAGTHSLSFQTVILLGSPRVCAVSICTCGTCVHVALVHMGNWRPEFAQNRVFTAGPPCHVPHIYIYFFVIRNRRNRPTCADFGSAV